MLLLLLVFSTDPGPLLFKMPTNWFVCNIYLVNVLTSASSLPQGKFIRINFDVTGYIVGANVETCILTSCLFVGYDILS